MNGHYKLYFRGKQIDVHVVTKNHEPYVSFDLLRLFIFRDKRHSSMCLYMHITTVPTRLYVPEYIVYPTV